MSTSSNLSKGFLGEQLAVDFLKKKGYKILLRNFKARYGEIDLIATFKHILVFVEVKTRWGIPYGRPEEAVTSWKLKSVVKTAEYFKLLNPELPETLQIDVVAVQLTSDDRLLSIDHLPNVTG